jgi:tocopherol O-methyltransferase
MQRSGSTTGYNDKAKVREHYDRVSPYYYALWGEHIHHGYWIRGDETKERAQVQLIEHLAEAAGIRPACRILDVGCGFGASTIYLARNYQAEAIGITISPVQVEMAMKAATKENANATFLLMDAEEMKFDQLFDVIWSVESISHYPNREKFFAAARRLLNPGGTLALIDWFKREGLQEAEYQRSIRPIEKGMLVELRTMKDYETSLHSHGLHVTTREIMNKNCAKTWDVGLDIIKDRKLWELAMNNGREFFDYLQAFRAMKAGFASGNFVYGLMVAKKASQ